MEGKAVNGSFALGHERPLCHAKKLGLCPLENGGYSLEGLVLHCDRISFAFYKNYSGVGQRVSGGKAC